MVLAELGQRISSALVSLNAAPVVDEAVSGGSGRRSRCPTLLLLSLCFLQSLLAQYKQPGEPRAGMHTRLYPRRQVLPSPLPRRPPLPRSCNRPPLIASLPRSTLAIPSQVLDACLKEIATALLQVPSGLQQGAGGKSSAGCCTSCTTRVFGRAARVVLCRCVEHHAMGVCSCVLLRAALQADVNVRLVANLRNNVKKRVNMEALASGLNKQKVIEKVSWRGATGLWCRFARGVGGCEGWAGGPSQLGTAIGQVTGPAASSQRIYSACNERPTASISVFPRRLCLTSCAACWMAATRRRPSCARGKQTLSCLWACRVSMRGPWCVSARAWYPAALLTWLALALPGPAPCASQAFATPLLPRRSPCACCLCSTASLRCSPCRCRQDHHLHQVRLPVEEEGVQAVHGGWAGAWAEQLWKRYVACNRRVSRCGLWRYPTVVVHVCRPGVAALRVCQAGGVTAVPALPSSRRCRCARIPSVLVRSTS